MKENEKNVELSALLDFYGSLLTAKQADALDLYYNQDLSLTEIAELMNITRQGVRDNIKRGEKQLEDFEAVLHLAEKFGEITTVCNVMKENAEKLRKLGASDGIVNDILYDIEKIETII